MENKERRKGAITENRESFQGLSYTKRHSVRSLASARKHAKKLVGMGYPVVHIEKEGRGSYGIYTRGRKRS